MNKRQKEVEKAKLTAEEKELNHLKAIYKKAAEDVSNKIAIHDGTINVLLKDYDNLDDVQKSILQSKIYQKQFQESLQKQLNGFLADLNSGQYKSIDEYLNGCYETGFLGSMYDIHGQGIPIITPIDQKKVVKAKDIDSKINKKLYERLGDDVDILKKRIANNISRGIATSDSFANIARNIASASNMGFNRAMRIARTEGHRIQATAAFDAQHAAKKAGADIVKQWDAALDSRTRDSHRELDGQIRELDELFEVNGHTARFPSDFGRPEEDINCRCALLQRARWAMDEDELQTLKDRAAYYGLDKTETLKEFAEKFNIAWKEELIDQTIRNLPKIEYDINVKGLNVAKAGVKLEKIGDAEYTVTLAARESVAWDDVSDNMKNRIRWKAPSRTNKPFAIDKGQYDVQPYVVGSSDWKKRDEIGKHLGGNYIGTSWYSKYGTIFEIDFYQKDDQIIYSLGLANVEKKLTKESLDNIIQTVQEREKIIGERLKKNGIKFAQVKAREGDDWVNSMKEFHRSIAADGHPAILSKDDYDAVKNPVLYRGIAPSSHLRKDITTTLSPQKMADGFFKDDKPFPSRGIYGDGVAYCSPSLEKIGGQYASANGTIASGGKIIEFKLKENAKTISYEDAVAMFEDVAAQTNSDLLFNKNQRKTDHEVGKAMNALGYDVIIKENGDNTGIPFYVILNRGALVAKEDWTTVTVTPEWLRKAKNLW